MDILHNILANTNLLRAKIIHIIANLSWQKEAEAEILFLAILWYIVLIYLLILIHHKTLKKHKKIHENLIELYDTIRYQYAKIQYKNPAIQDSIWIKIVMENEHQNYLTNAKIIKEEIISMEQKLEQKIVSDDQRKIIAKQTQKKARTKVCMEIIGRFTTLITAGVYKLFR